MMRISKPADWRNSDEVTPKEIYFNRRKFLAGVPPVVLGAREATECGGEPAQHQGRESNALRGRHHLQQLL